MCSNRFRPYYGAAAAWLLAAMLVMPAPASGQENAQQRLPLEKVVLFNSGVGFFEHRGQVEGDAQVDLKFNVDDINDLLKSMVLQDLGGGRISTITYGSMDPITKTLRTFAIDLTDNPTLGGLLGQLRGERIEVDAPNKITGVIVGVEKRQQRIKDEEPVEAEFLILLTDDGLRSLPLASLGGVKLLDDKLNTEFRQALHVLALGHASDKKTVTLNFLGNGERDVRVGYIQESPIWKTSYRLVLDDEDPPFLQGWAIVENTTEEDWKDVELTLVSGRPISFVMDLYQPLYVSRPIVEPELFASLRPQTYGQDLARKEVEFQIAGEAGKKQNLGSLAGGRRMAADKDRDSNGVTDFAAPAPASAGAGEALGLQLQQGGQSMAQAGDVGELFQYAIDTPVSLPRQQSAMLPIVNDSIEGEKVAIYNPAVQAKHPLNGLRLKNTSGLHLMQGPITVFDGGAYAGDARIEDLQPDTERLISYSLDLDTEVAAETRGVPEQLVSVRLLKGVLYSTRKYERSMHYTIKNSGKRAEKVLVEYPKDASWKLMEPKEATETTRDLYRFAVQAEPGKPASLDLREEQTVSQQVAISNVDDGTIHYYRSAKVVSDTVKAALAELVERKQEIAKLAAQQQALEAEIKTIGEEQGRIRENMSQLDRNTDLYNRYVKKFGEQEDQIEKLRQQIAGIESQLVEKRQSLDAFLLALDLQ